ncbi:MAG: cell division protein ZapA [Alphaproteobacteria bacterium]
MGQVSVTINGRDYRVACEDGEEAHVTELADYIGGQVAELVDDVGQVGETRLLLMAGLVVADELSETREQLDAARGDAGRSVVVEEALAERLETLAARIEDIAVRLKGS